MQILIANSEFKNAITYAFKAMLKNSENHKGFKMVKKILIALAIISGMLVQLNAYNGQVAANYALKYVYNYNSNYASYDSGGGDCTNFVSQAIRAGGMTFDWLGVGISKWTVDSYSWVNATGLEERFSSQRYSNGKKVAKFIASKYSRRTVDVKVGDVIFFNWSNNGKNRFTHATIVTYAFYCFIYVTYHSTDTKNSYLVDEINKADNWICYRPVSM